MFKSQRAHNTKKEVINIKNVKRSKPKNKDNYNKIIFSWLIILVILSLTVLFVLSKNPQQDTSFENHTTDLKNFENSYSVIMYLPAVDVNNTGYLTTLKVEAIPGTGRTLVDIDGLLFWEDTQQSIRKAKSVAELISKVNTSTVDLIYTIKANASLIGGESAGAALTIATIAALENKPVEEGVIITGSINHDGTIGPVQSVLQKAQAAKEFGADLFLVPLLQSRDVLYETNKHCEPIGVSEICTNEQIPRKINISEEAGITVREVENITDALNYFIR